MAFSVPTLKEVSSVIENGFSSAFYGTSGNLRVGVLKVMSKVIAGGCYLPILFCNYIFRNSFIDSADVENLVRYGGWYNLPHKVASHARGTVLVTFNGAVTLPVGTILVDTNTNDEYETLDEATSTSSSFYILSIRVMASEVGSQGNRSTSEVTKLSVRDGDVSGISSIVTESIGGGASYEVSVNGTTEYWGEDVESYRKRLKYRRQHQPMGGCDADYKQWAERFSAVTDAYVFANFPSTNSVSVFCADYNGNVEVNDTELEEVIAYITDASRKPITADVNVASVDPVDIALTIALPSIGGSVRNDVINTLTKYFKGFGFGETLTKDLIQKVLVENGVCDSCSVTQIKKNGSIVTSTGYTFAKEYVSSKIHGEVFNTNRIDALLTLVVA